MLNKFRDVIDQLLTSNSSPIYVAVSGGCDSMVLLDLCRQLSIEIVVLHCHFGLREDAYKETQVVKDYCSKHKIKLHIKYFPGERLKGKGNLQEVCRIWRYDWFDRFVQKSPESVILTAHHARDNIETLFLNLSRGAGLRGLKGIPVARGPYRRPLLSFSHSALRQYASNNAVPFEEDASNFKSSYDRNFVRLEVLPKLRERFEAFDEQAQQSIKHIVEINEFVQEELNQWSNKKVTHRDKYTFVSDPSDWPPLLLKMLLLDYNFNRSNIEDLFSNLHKSGRLFSSATHTLVITQYGFTIRRGGDQKVDLALATIGRYEHFDTTIWIQNGFDHEFQNANGDKACLHIPKSEWPLNLRTWKAGDRITPLGMHGHSKKVKDILTDEKIDQLRKTDALVLTNSKGEIMWLVGHRISENHKVSPTQADEVYCILVESTA